MAQLSSDVFGPPRTLELFRMFLDASSKGEQAVLILETKMKTVTSKFRCVESFSGDPVEHTARNTKKKKENPARARRSKLRLEQFQLKKEQEKVAGGPSTLSGDTSSNKVVTVLESNTVEDKTTGSQTALSSSIQQVDGLEDNNEVGFTFISDYGEEDILDSFLELFPGINANLASRVRVSRLSADHLCKVVLHPVQAQSFSWPVMDPVNTEVFKEIRRIQK